MFSKLCKYIMCRPWIYKIAGVAHPVYWWVYSKWQKEELHKLKMMEIRVKARLKGMKNSTSSCKSIRANIEGTVQRYCIFCFLLKHIINFNDKGEELYDIAT